MPFYPLIEAHCAACRKTLPNYPQCNTKELKEWSSLGCLATCNVGEIEVFANVRRQRREVVVGQGGPRDSKCPTIHAPVELDQRSFCSLVNASSRKSPHNKRIYTIRPQGFDPLSRTPVRLKLKNQGPQKTSTITRVTLSPNRNPHPRPHYHFVPNSEDVPRMRRSH